LAPDRISPITISSFSIYQTLIIRPKINYGPKVL
jgi:hypothetical protein